VVAAGISVRDGRPGEALAAVAGAALLFVPSAIDTGYLLWQAEGGPAGTTSVTVGYRVPYDLGKLTSYDIVLVGDSFVWGQGVETRDRVGDVLQAEFQRRDPATRVYSLGMIGTGLNDYVKALGEVPPAPKIRRVILSFYQNDMPPRDTLGGWMERLSLALGRSSVSARLLLDISRLSLAPTVDGYMELVLGDFDQQGTAFPARWQMLVDSFDTLYRLAAERSLEQPILAIVPMLVATNGEKWRDAHRRVAAAAAAAGFVVVDLYDDYETGTAGALRYRVTANDLHFDVAGNRLFAQKLAAAMIGRVREP
jgi:lysophospholipase L1-like esterase